MRDLPSFSILTSLAVAVAAFASWQTFHADPVSTKAMYGILALLLSFLVGLALGERSKSAYCNRIVLANRQLGDQNRELLRVNASLLERVGESHGEAAHLSGEPERSFETFE
ncbi:hypothetical protein KOR34_35960 [Posidoniimonas corsicana]|uniref:Uncharacterized protein n=1 Tax=Posidoniimonas corsicana TaxID=1938618 RepID=A0A5C5V7P6_9BACT|nr:hypothetical protein [Posidoniimonas corsicana]TWT33762.1 hypothetical protein KOR34_35960 [Posidoniimonas corsicana]